VTAKANEIKTNVPFMRAVNDTIFRANGKAIIGLPEIARCISLLIKNNFWSARHRDPGIDNGMEKFIIQCNCASLRYE